MVKIEEIKSFFNHAIILIAFNVLVIQRLFPEAPDAIKEADTMQGFSQTKS